MVIKAFEKYQSITRTVTITRQELDFVKRNCLSLSKLLQTKIIEMAVKMDEKLQ